MAIVKREAPDQRCHVRVTIPIGVRIQGASYTIVDWSLGGFRIDEFLGKVTEGDHIFAHFTLSYQGLDVSFSTDFIVTRVSEDGQTVAGRFVKLNDREKELLSYVMLGSTGNGVRASLIESLARIDIPVTPISPVPTPKEAPTPGRFGQLVRRVLYSLLYGAVGVGLGLAVIVTIYWYFFRLDLDYAVVTQPLSPVLSQDLARCKEVLVEEGATVSANQPLLRLEDDVLTREMETNQILLRTAKADLALAEARVEKEKEKLAMYKRITQDKLTSVQEQVNALTNERRAAENKANRTRELIRSGGATRQELETDLSAVAAMNGQLQQATANLRIAERSLDAVEKGDFFDQYRLVGDLPQLLVNLEDARERLRIATDRLALSQEHVNRLTYRAPFAGRVVRVLKPAAATVNRGEPLLILEKAGEEPMIDAFVTQDEASSLAVGSKALITVPGLAKTFQAQVVKIDRTTGFLTEMQAHLKDSDLRYNGRGQQDRSAYVQLHIADELSDEDKQLFSGGMPVTISVAKRYGPWSKILSMLGS
jgi:multidrug resistance efflux pump